MSRQNYRVGYLAFWIHEVTKAIEKSKKSDLFVPPIITDTRIQDGYDNAFYTVYENKRRQDNLGDSHIDQLFFAILKLLVTLESRNDNRLYRMVANRFDDAIKWDRSNLKGVENRNVVSAVLQFCKDYMLVKGDRKNTDININRFVRSFSTLYEVLYGRDDGHNEWNHLGKMLCSISGRDVEEIIASLGKTRRNNLITRIARNRRARKEREIWRKVGKHLWRNGMPWMALLYLHSVIEKRTDPDAAEIYIIAGQCAIEVQEYSRTLSYCYSYLGMLREQDKVDEATEIEGGRIINNLCRTLCLLAGEFKVYKGAGLVRKKVIELAVKITECKDVYTKAFHSDRIEAFSIEAELYHELARCVLSDAEEFEESYASANDKILSYLDKSIGCLSRYRRQLMAGTISRASNEKLIALEAEISRVVLHFLCRKLIAEKLQNESIDMSIVKRIVKACCGNVPFRSFAGVVEGKADYAELAKVIRGIAQESPLEEDRLLSICSDFLLLHLYLDDLSHYLYESWKISPVEEHLSCLKILETRYLDWSGSAQRLILSQRSDDSTIEDKSRLYYYCSIQNALHLFDDLYEDDDTGRMLPSEEAPRKAKKKKSAVNCLTLMNANYMNDPNEGLELAKYLSGGGQLFGESAQGFRDKSLSQRYTFMRSFTSLSDNLTMWSMYGKSPDGEKQCDGCRVEINPVTFIVADENAPKEFTSSKSKKRKTKGSSAWSSFRVSKVIYMQDKGGKSGLYPVDLPRSIVALLEGIVECVRSLSTQYDDLVNTGFQEGQYAERIKETVLKELGTLQYLVKDDSYRQEHEKRIVLQLGDDRESLGLIRVLSNGERSNPKLLCVNPPYQVYIESIMLGPNANDADKWEPDLKYRLDRMKIRAAENGINIAPTVQHSSIPLR